MYRISRAFGKVTKEPQRHSRASPSLTGGGGHISLVERLFGLFKNGQTQLSSGAGYVLLREARRSRSALTTIKTPVARPALRSLT